MESYSLTLNDLLKNNFTVKELKTAIKAIGGIHNIKEVIDNPKSEYNVWCLLMNKAKAYEKLKRRTVNK